MLYCITDIGSNTVKMNIFDDSGSTSDKVCSVYAESTTVGLGGMREKGRLRHDGIDILCDILARYKRHSLEYGCDKFFAFATASIRNIENTDEVIAVVGKQTGVSVDLLSGEDEARLSFAGLRLEYPEAESGLMIDMGGGSTELISFSPEGSSSPVSMPLGCITLRNMFTDIKKVFPEPEQLDGIKKYTLAALGESAPRCESTDAYLIGGTARAVFRISGLIPLGKNPSEIAGEEINYITVRGRRFPYRSGYNSSLRDKLSISAEKFSEIFWYYSRALDDQAIAAELKNGITERFSTIVPGMASLDSIFDFYGITKCFLVTAGVREGYFKRLILNR